MEWSGNKHRAREWHFTQDKEIKLDTWDVTKKFSVMREIEGKQQPQYKDRLLLLRSTVCQPTTAFQDMQLSISCFSYRVSVFC
jgi:hypothetical protein